MKIDGLKVTLGLVLLTAIVKIARADTTNIYLRQLNAYVKDGAIPDSPAYGLMVAGYDGTNAQFLNLTAAGALVGTYIDNAVWVEGTDSVTMSGYYFDNTAGTALTENDVAAGRIDSKRAVVNVIESDATRGLFTEVLTAGSDSVANTTNGLFTYSALVGWDASDSQWERVMVQDGTGTMGRLIIGLCSNSDGTCADGGSYGADDIAANTNGNSALNTRSFVFGFDEDDTNWDRLYSYDTDGDNVATEAEGVTLAVTNFPEVYDLTGANFDRMSVGHVLGAGLPGTATLLGVDNTSSCMTALSVGYYRVQVISVTESVVYVCRSGTSCTATTSDSPYEAGMYYYETVTDAAANDVMCAIDAAGTNSANLFATPMTF